MGDVIVLSELGIQLKKEDAEFDITNFGNATLNAAIGDYNDKFEMKDKGGGYFARLKYANKLIKAKREDKGPLS